MSVAPVDSAAALVVVAAKNVDFDKSFITINMPNPVQLDDISADDANDHDWFVSTLLSTGDFYTTQLHRIKPGQLKDGLNSLGIHTRSASGTTLGNLDDFRVARIFLVYTSAT